MRGAIHLLATLIVIPYALLAGGFLLLGHAIGEGSILVFFDRLLNQAAWLVPWGIAGIGMGFLALAALGLVSRTRAVGGLLLALVASLSIVLIVSLSATPVTADEAVFLLPCVAALLFGAWVFASERTRLHAVGNST